jgi:hypothetical protein
MDRSRWRAALNSVDEQDNLCFFKGIKQIKAAARQLRKLASTVASRPEAVDDFEPYIIVGRQGAAATDYQQSIG